MTLGRPKEERQWQRSETPADRARAAIVDILVLSATVVWLELALVRWLPAYVPYLAFTTHLVFVASVFGVALGWAAPRRTAGVGVSTPAALLALISGGRLIEVLHERWLDGFSIAQKDEYFGLISTNVVDLATFPVPLNALIVATFACVSAVFVGPAGELAGIVRRTASPRLAYATHLAGCGLGAMLFAVGSYLEWVPVAWFSVPLVTLAAREYMTTHARPWCGMAMGCLLVLLVGLPSDRGAHEHTEVWSAYSRLLVNRDNLSLSVNLMGHQQMVEQDSPMRGYSLPYQVLETRQLSAKSVLVIGAGAGNDVAQALARGAQEVTAVELDGAIARLGRDLHPNQPYRDPRVRLVIGDGRRILSTLADSVDLVVYGFVDSLVRHSSYTGLRSESFLYTTEAFKQVRRVLADDGHLVVYEYFRQGWLVVRLAAMLEEVFGEGSTTVYTLPGRRSVSSDDDLNGTFTMLVATRAAKDTVRQENRARLVESSSPSTASLSPTAVEGPSVARAVTDDWPYPYLSKPGLSPLAARQWQFTMIAAAIVSACLLLSGRLRVQPVHSTDAAVAFLLGAAFMLLQARMVSQAALWFGSTWLVTAIVIVGVTCMGAIGSVVAPKPRGAKTILGAGAIVLAALTVSIVVPSSAWLTVPLVGAFAGVLVLACPLLVSSMMFASLLRDTTAPSVLALNAFGTICGAWLENLSTVAGFKALAVETGVLYGIVVILSVTDRRRRGQSRAEQCVLSQGVHANAEGVVAAPRQVRHPSDVSSNGMVVEGNAIGSGPDVRA